MVAVLAFGSNSSGQLAIGTMEDAHRPVACMFAEDAGVIAGTWHVCGGGNHAFMWSQDGTRLLASGSARDGELGMGSASSTPVTAWTPTELPAASVRQIACGWNHTLLLDSHGSVWAAGSNSFGQLGVQPMHAGAWTHVPPGGGGEGSQPLEFAAVACGMRHSLALDRDGAVFGWGANRVGQLGIPPSRECPNVPAMARVSAGLPPIAMIACGRSHSVLVARDLTTVFVAGQDTYAQCGPSECTPVTGTWRTFQLPRPARKLCAGWEFCAVLLAPAEDGSADGRIVAWGRSDHGQLAHPTPGRRYCREPAEVPLADVRDLACGSNHCVALTRSGAVYAWGWNEHGNAGDPSLSSTCSP
ncbi:alpha tubulin suppressor [Coemansia biformis]|uniref:Alpha tubulin suppressor n=1 Tax=Coemansia biformis TaxID=1286918 RepID=A0A9W7YBD6_9FUNG|nr:alpha tubulin suppressor [Coemansia biformis]